MKKIYMQPMTECMIANIKTTILAGSDTNSSASWDDTTGTGSDNVYGDDATGSALGKGGSIWDAWD